MCIMEGGGKRMHGADATIAAEYPQTGVTITVVGLRWAHRLVRRLLQSSPPRSRSGRSDGYSLHFKISLACVVTVLIAAEMCTVYDLRQPEHSPKLGPRARRYWLGKH